MTFWNYIIIGCIIQAIIMVERQLRIEGLWELTKEASRDIRNWVSLIILVAFNIIVWPVSIYCEIRLIQNGM